MLKTIQKPSKINLKIVGSGFSKETFAIGKGFSSEIIKLLEFQNVHVVGYVKDVYNVLNECRVAIAPLNFGKGINGKVCNYLSHGIPSVINEVAAECMRLKHLNDCLTAKNEDQFVKHILRLYNSKSLWNKIRKNGLIAFDKHFSKDIFLSQLDRIFLKNFI